jgi:hypothetical protein
MSTIASCTAGANGPAAEQCRAEISEAILRLMRPVMQAADAVRGVPGVTGVSIYGHTLRVFTRMTEGLERDLDTALCGREVVVRGIRAVPPTLEDVFMSLTRTAPNDAQDA